MYICIERLRKVNRNQDLKWLEIKSQTKKRERQN